MKRLFSVAAAALAMFSAAAFAQHIGWNPVTPGNMQWSNAPGGHTTYQQVGPLTFGSDGSSAYSTGQGGVSNGVTSQRSGDIVTYSNGNRGIFNGNGYVEYNSSGKQVRHCALFEGQVSCTNL